MNERSEYSIIYYIQDNSILYINIISIDIKIFILYHIYQEHRTQYIYHYNIIIKARSLETIVYPLALHYNIYN